jgi:hypothetical protein
VHFVDDYQTQAVLESWIKEKPIEYWAVEESFRALQRE